MNKRYFKRLLLAATALVFAVSVRAEVRLPHLFSSHMVLQRDTPVAIWGWADKGESIQILFADQKIKTKADAQGCWSAQLPARPAGGPYTLVVKGKTNTITLDDILMGDVWVCSGQSNMEWPLDQVNNAEAEVAAANHPNLRLFTVPHNPRGVETEDIASEWKCCTPENATHFTAVGYFFGRDLNRETNIPIGLIANPWGGTRIECWISPDTYRTLTAEQRAFYADQGHDINFPNPELDSLYRAIDQGMALFTRMIDSLDPGMSEKWYEDSFDTTSWQSIPMPAYWSTIPGLSNVDGHLWLKTTVTLPAGVDQKTGRLILGQIDDNDRVWINGIALGENSGYLTERDYTIPYTFLHEGKNTITLRITDTRGDGGIKAGTPIYLEVNNIRYPLNKNWKGKLSMSNAAYYDKSYHVNGYPSMLYLGMVNPLTRFTIKGAIWYQGESNDSYAYTYRTLFPTMIKNWREKWGTEFPFYWVQLANFMAADSLPSESAWAELREAQTMALALPKTGQALTIDIGDPADIHPRNKQEVGRRLSLIALHNDYGRTDLVYSGPQYRSMEIEGNKAILSFDHIGSGLITKERYGYLKGFTIAGADGKFVWAQAKIDGDKVVVWSDCVSEPVAVRYNWGNNPDGTLYNAEGLPAVPFRTDDWKGITQ